MICGGGDVAVRKALNLLEEQALVRVVAKEPKEKILSLARKRKIQLIQGNATAEHLRGAFLAVLATGDPATDHELSRYALDNGILACCASDPSRGNVHFPAAMKRGPLQVAFATDGTSPALSRRLRDMLSSQWSDSLDLGLVWLSEIREYCLERIVDEEHRRRLLKKAAEDVMLLLEGKPPVQVRKKLSALVPDLHLSYGREEEESDGENV